MRAGPDAVPRIGLVGAWFDPYDPKAWSGLTRNLIVELDRLGMFARYRDATPWAKPSLALRRWLSKRRRLGDAWTLEPEMRALAAVASLSRRVTGPSGADFWVVAAGGFALPVRGPLVSLSEISPAQLERLGPAGASAFGLGGIDDRALAFVVRARRRLHRRSRACCVVSSWAGASLVQEEGIAQDKVHVVGCGRNVDIDAPSERDWSNPRFLFVGNDWKRKNGDAVVRAFSRLRSQVPSARLDVVGGHPPLDVEGVAGHGRVSFDDPQGRPKLEELFASATCFVMPSLVEPFGIVYVEAAGAGVPSIATSVGGTRDSVGDGGVLVDPHDEAALLDAMLRLADPEIAQSLGRRAVLHSRELTWRKTAERVVRAVAPQLAEELGFARFL
jgi:glycosyltransferase involved in cell wall biosynthesis